MATEYELTLNDYLSIMRRRAPYLIGIFFAVLLISVVVALAIPATYKSTGTIMIETQQISENIVPAAIKGQIEERISIIKQRILTRDSLLRIANKYDLFKDRTGPASNVLIEEMRKRVTIELIGSDEMFTSEHGKATIAFTLSFEDRSPEIAYRVATDLTTLFLNWNQKLRTEGASEATAFLGQEAEKLKFEVERLDKQIATFKQQNSSALPEQVGLRMNMLNRAESDLRELERDYRSTRDEIRSLEVELASTHAGPGSDSNKSLPALKAEYAKLSAIYNESYPDMRLLKRRIEAMEKSGSSQDAENPPESAPTMTLYRIQSRLASAKNRLTSLADQRKMLHNRIAQNERSMMHSPQVEQGLEVLIRDRDSAQKKYEEIHSKRVTAKIAQNLESENSSESFTLLEPPLLPDRAFKPDRAKIIALGFLLALASAAGAVLLMASFDKQIRGIEAVEMVLGQRPLAVIPYLYIQEEWASRKLLVKRASIASGGMVAVIVLAMLFIGA